MRDRLGLRGCGRKSRQVVAVAPPAIEHIAKAKAVCETCDVKVGCLEYALMTNQDAGVWGGLTEDDRRKIRRERRKAARAAQAAAQAQQ